MSGVDRKLESGAAITSFSGVIFAIFAARSTHDILYSNLSPSLRVKLILVVTIWGALASWSAAVVLILARCRSMIKRVFSSMVGCLLEDDATGEVIMEGFKALTRSLARRMEHDEVLLLPSPASYGR